MTEKNLKLSVTNITEHNLRFAVSKTKNEM